jgi:hypothetical protein
LLQGGLQGAELALGPVIVHYDFCGVGDVGEDFVGVGAEDYYGLIDWGAIFDGDCEGGFLAEGSQGFGEG